MSKPWAGLLPSLNLRAIASVLAGALLCSCVYNDPYAQQRANPAKIAAHNSRIGYTATPAYVAPYSPPVATYIPPVASRPFVASHSESVLNRNRYDPNSLANPYGAGSPYKANGLMNPYSQYGSPYSNKSWTNPYATDAPKLYDSQGNYRGKLSSNRYDPDSTANPYGRYGSPYSPDSVNNPYGAGNPYSSQPIYVVPHP